MRRGVRKGIRLNQGASAAPVEEYERLDRQLLAELDGGFAAVARIAGEALACRSGCSDCCHGPFPINALDVRRLREGLARLERCDDPRGAAIRSRAEQAISALTPGFPGDPLDGVLRQDTVELDRFFDTHAGLACPALNPDSGRCELYDHRPVSCRTYGPPLRFDRHRSPPCDLCFRGASPSEVERCRYQPDPRQLEERLLRTLHPDGRERQTLIAFALVRGATC